MAVAVDVAATDDSADIFPFLLILLLLLLIIYR